MQYLLFEEELKNLVPKKLLELEKEKVEMLVKAYRKLNNCVKSFRQR